MSKMPKGAFYARKRDKWYNLRTAPKGSHIWFRICVDGHRYSIPMETTDPDEAIRRRDAWLAGIRLDSHEAFLESMIAVGEKARRELSRKLAGKGVTPPAKKR